MYEIKEETLYNRAFFSFAKGDQQINVAFEPLEGDEYLMIIFAEDGLKINEPHDPVLSDTLDHVLNSFDQGQELEYFIAAL